VGIIIDVAEEKRVVAMAIIRVSSVMFIANSNMRDIDESKSTFILVNVHSTSLNTRLKQRPHAILAFHNLYTRRSNESTINE
jgi:hypothetical protein